MMARHADPLLAIVEALDIARDAAAAAGREYIRRPANGGPAGGASAPEREPRPIPVDHTLPTVRGRLEPIDAARLALELRAALVSARAVRRRIMAGAAGPDDALTLAWLAVDALTLAAILEPAEGYRAARIAAEAAAESGGRTARAHVVNP